MNKEKTKQLLNDNGITVKKHFGQNFLCDDNVLNNIIEKSNLSKNINVIEIGPGLGYLTSYLSKHANHVLCYEIDGQMVNHLKTKNFDNVTIIHDDFLKRNLKEDLSLFSDDKDIYVIANLPYYITTAILLKILEETNRVSKIVAMMQMEVAKRFCGKPSTKDYNSLSVLVQYYTNAKLLFNVSPNSFYPEPGVESSVISLEYKSTPEFKTTNLEYFLKFNRAIFTQRRKTLYNNIVNSFHYEKESVKKCFETFKINANVRSESLSVEEIVNLSNIFFEEFEK